MELFEYIKSQLPQMPNVAIMKQFGASDELVEYVKETTWNTNLGMMETFSSGNTPTPSGEVWYSGIVDSHNNKTGEGEAILTATDKANTSDLLNNQSSYTVFGNGVELTLESNGYWYHPSTEYTGIFGFGIEDEEGSITIYASTINLGLNTPVEITVKHK